mmetsp:Transcript_7400/g.20999  ORF Transcript_7400/g.20999 Transcript_7400/m.20999 type:complete len:227 (-) Transcript_7400:602-1282(-)
MASAEDLRGLIHPGQGDPPTRHGSSDHDEPHGQLVASDQALPPEDGPREHADHHQGKRHISCALLAVGGHRGPVFAPAETDLVGQVLHARLHHLADRPEAHRLELGFLRPGPPFGRRAGHGAQRVGAAGLGQRPSSLRSALVAVRALRRSHVALIPSLIFLALAILLLFDHPEGRQPWRVDFRQYLRQNFLLDVPLMDWRAPPHRLPRAPAATAGERKARLRDVLL